MHDTQPMDRWDDRVWGSGVCRINEPDNGDDKDDNHNTGVDQLIVSGQPIGKIYIEIVFLRVGISPRDDSQRAKELE